MRIWVLLFSLLTAAAQPAWSASSPALASLEQQLMNVVAAQPGDVGVAALDLTTGESVSIKGNEPFPMASTVKVAIAANYLAQVEHGRRTLDDIIAGRSARSLMEAMLIHSDNHATDLLLRNLGGPATIQAWLTQTALPGMRVDRTIDRLLRDRRDLYDVRDSSTPLAMVELLRRIDRAQMLKVDSRNYLLDLMGRCMTGRNRIRGLLPFGTPVQNKTGTLNGLSTDVGFITLPDGRRVAIAIFARGGSDRSRTIAEAARAVYYGLSNAFSLRTGAALSAH